MGRLSVMKPALARLPSRVGVPRDPHGHSKAAEPWRGWYKVKAWEDLRIEVFVRDNYTCQMCGRVTGRPIADHVKPHRGDRDLFFAKSNVQTLCKSPCHDSLKQRFERSLGGGSGAGGARHASVGAMSHPSWFRAVHVPLTVVCGPPGSGKSTFVRQSAGSKDLVICFDQIARGMFEGKGAQRVHADLTVGQVADVLRVRNELLGDLMRAEARSKWSAAWLIVSEPSASRRTWWAEKLGAEIVVMLTPAEVCRARATDDAANGDERGAAALATIETWWATYRPAVCDRIVRPAGG